MWSGQSMISKLTGSQAVRLMGRACHETGNGTVTGLHLIRVDVRGLCKCMLSADAVT